MVGKSFLEEYRLLEREQYFNRYMEIEGFLKTVFADLQDEEQKEAYLEYLETEMSRCPDWMRIHLLSFCFKLSGNKEYVLRLLEAIGTLDDNQIGEYTRLFYYWQINTAVFQNRKLESFEVRKKLTELYKRLFVKYSGVLGIKDRCYIPVCERNWNRVFVFTAQVQGMLHAPTKTLLDRCYVLQKYMNKKVSIINTAMLLTQKGAAPFFSIQKPGYESRYLDLQKVVYQDQTFDFLQCKNSMPDWEVIAALISKIIEERPGYMLNIGGNDLCADLCAMFIPEITVSTVFSKIATSCGEYQIVNNTLTEADRSLLAIMGVDEQKVKHTLFTFAFKEQKHQYTKEEIGFAENAFILLIVGWRLDEEIQDDFLAMLEQTLEEQKEIEVAFMGRYGEYESMITRYPKLHLRSKNLGVQEDALAITECCSLYVNPERNGGGSSVAEALYQGLPAVTLPVGDVAAAAGSDFFVQNYTEMKRQILCYAQDKRYYEEMSGKAKERAQRLMDSKTGFCRVIEEIEREMTEKVMGE